MNSYQDFKDYMSTIQDINAASALLSWDQEVYMPKGSARFRAQQQATLQLLSHQMFTKKEFGVLLEKLNNETLGHKESRNIALTLKKYKLSVLFDDEFIARKSKLISAAFESWQRAKTEGTWEDYYPNFSALVELIKEEIEIIGYKDHPYDVMLDKYEPGATVQELDVIFDEVKKSLLPLLQKIRQQKQVQDDFLFLEFDEAKQWEYGLEVLKNMGYDMQHGRQDVSSHPFTINFSPEDVRVTTRLSKNNFPMMLWSCIHEGGHALYEQGIPVSEYGLPSGEAISLGVHESQSRLWENNVGRSLSFWKFHYPELQQRFPKQLKDVDLDIFYRAINKVESNLIRTQADELHYHFHVLIRYELERDLLSGQLKAEDMKTAWDDLYEKYLGIRPGNDQEGILQDIHWSHGSFGYFPTYSLGSFYAAQFYTQASKEISNLEIKISQGNNEELLQWLRSKIHIKGHQWEASELCEQITGRKLELSDFMNYVIKKYDYIYSINYSNK